MSTERKYSIEDTPRGLEIRTFGADERDLRVNKTQSELVSGQDVSGFSGDWMFPPVPVSNRVGIARQISPEDWGGVESAIRVPGTRPKRIGFNVTSATYNCRNYAYMSLVTLEDKANADDLSVADASRYTLRAALAVGKDRRAANAIALATNVGTVCVPSSALNAGGDAIAMFTTLISNVTSASGFRPTRLWAGGVAWESIKTNTFARNSCGGFVTPQRLGEFLRIDVKVADGFQSELVRYGGWKNPCDDAVFVAVQQGTSGNDFLPRYGCSPFWRPAGVETRFTVQQKTNPSIHADEIFADSWECELVLNKDFAAILKGVNSAQANGI